MIVVFDLSGVFFNNGLKVAVQSISREFSLDPKTLEYVLNGDFAARYRKGLTQPGEFWARAKEYLGIDDIERVKEIFFSAYVPKAESVQLLRELRNHGVSVAYLSNGPKDRTEYLDSQHHFLSLFDYGLFSYEAHAWKPEPRMYGLFLERFGLEGGDCIYIEDKESNIPPAREVGMDTILYVDDAQCRRELHARGIVF
jgi:HAD superfamily hydrolase (TIGR01509 family)